jgi:molybdopterin converting factor small subunit
MDASCASSFATRAASSRSTARSASVLVVRGDTLVPGDAVLADDDVIEIRPVISGGAR